MSAAVSGVPAKAIVEIVRTHLPRSVRVPETLSIPVGGNSSTVRVRDACRGCDWIGDHHAGHVAEVALATALPSLREQIAAEVMGPVRALLANYEAWKGDRDYRWTSSAQQREDLRNALDEAALSAPVQAAEPEVSSDDLYYPGQCCRGYCLTDARGNGTHDAVDPPCRTCSGSSRETVGMVCPTCGRDYAVQAAEKVGGE